MRPVVDRCPPAESLPDIALLPLGDEQEDSRRRHLERCPRCQARLADYRDFMAGTAPCPPRDLQAALATLDADLREAVAGEAVAAEATRPDRARPRVRSLHPGFAHPLARTAFALAALFLILVALDALPDRPQRREIRLRAGEDRPAAGTALGLEAPRPLSDGGLELSWRALPGADAYRLRLLAPDLGLLAERDCGSATWIRLTAAELAEARAAGAILVWQVEARAGGDPLAVSPPATFALPARH